MKYFATLHYQGAEIVRIEGAEPSSVYVPLTASLTNEDASEHAHECVTRFLVTPSADVGMSAQWDNYTVTVWRGEK